MRFLIAEMLLLLVAAFALGLGVGAMLGRAQRRPADQTPLEVEAARLRSLLRVNGIDPDPPLPSGSMTLAELEAPTDDLIELEPLDDGDPEPGP